MVKTQFKSKEGNLMEYQQKVLSKNNTKKQKKWGQPYFFLEIELCAMYWEVQKKS